jgi:sulfur carrier protein ThiS
MTDQPERTSSARTKEAIFTFRHETFTIQPGGSVRDAILQCGLNPETVLAMRDGTLITDEVIVRVGDRIRLVATISGG